MPENLLIDALRALLEEHPDRLATLELVAAIRNMADNWTDPECSVAGHMAQIVAGAVEHLNENGGAIIGSRTIWHAVYPHDTVTFLDAGTRNQFASRAGKATYAVLCSSEVSIDQYARLEGFRSNPYGDAPATLCSGPALSPGDASAGFTRTGETFSRPVSEARPGERDEDR